MVFGRIFGKKPYETEVVDGIEVGRTIIDGSNVPSQSFGSCSSSGSSRRSSPVRHQTFPVRADTQSQQRNHIRRRPAPLEPGSLTFRNPANHNGTENVWSPVRRSGAVRRTTNPLTLRNKAISSNQDNDVNYPARPDGVRAAVSRSNTYQDQSLTSSQQSEPAVLYDESESEAIDVDLSSFVPPLQWNSEPITPVRRGALRRGTNPLTVRNALQKKNHDTDSPGSARHRQPSSAGPPPSASSAASMLVRRRTLLRKENPPPVRRRRNTLQDNKAPPNSGNHSRQHRPSTANHHPDDIPLAQIQSFPRVLKTWVDTGMTACDVGRYAAQLLDGRDRFLNKLVTDLVDAQTFYTNIGCSILSEFNVRNDCGIPIYHNMPLGQTSLRASRPHDAHDKYSPIRALATEHPDRVNSVVICPKPRRAHMPMFLSTGLNMEWFTQSRSSDEETDPECWSPPPDFDDAVLREGPERKVRIVDPGPLPSSRRGSIHHVSELSPTGSPTGKNHRSGRSYSQSNGQSYSQSYSQSNGHSYTKSHTQSHAQSSGQRSNKQRTLVKDWDGIKDRGPFL